MVNIDVSDYVKGKLEVIKEEEGHKSLDSVIRVLVLERKDIRLTLLERKNVIDEIREEAKKKKACIMV